MATIPTPFVAAQNGLPVLEADFWAGMTSGLFVIQESKHWLLVTALNFLLELSLASVIYDLIMILLPDAFV